MDKKEVITIIRSLLTSNNYSSGMCALNKEFRDMIGIDIPLFGYGSLSSFLESIPDTVKLTGVYPIQKVSLVTNDASGHIQSLVKRQRRDKKCKKGVNLNPGGHLKSSRFSIRRNNKYSTINGKSSDAEQRRSPYLETEVEPYKNNRKLQNTGFQITNDIKSMEMPSLCQQKVQPMNHQLKLKKNNSVSEQTTSSSLEMTSQSSVDPSPLLRICDVSVTNFPEEFLKYICKLATV